MIVGLIIGILIYSLILTAVVLYKNSSNDFVIELLDIVVAGPICWVLFIIASIRQAIQGDRPKRFKSPYKSKQYIGKVVKYIVKNYRRLHNDDNEYFNFNLMTGKYCVSDIHGWEDLLVNRSSNEFMNNKFRSLMVYQKEATLRFLLKYFTAVTDDMMVEDGCNEKFINTAHSYGTRLFKLKN